MTTLGIAGGRFSTRFPIADSVVLRGASTRHLKGLVAAKGHVDLEGQAAGEVTEAQREVASAILNERFNSL